MAKYETRFPGEFNELLKRLEVGITQGSVSANLEDKSDYSSDNVRCAVRVFERYSMIGGNRVSLAITLIGNGNDLFISLITSGGSKAVFFKINTVGEESFLQCAIDIVDEYYRSR